MGSAAAEHCADRGNLVLVLPTAHSDTRSSCDFGWKLSAEHTFLSRSVLPLSLRTPLCQTDDLFVQSLQNVTLLLPPSASFYYDKHYTLLVI